MGTNSFEDFAPSKVGKTYFGWYPEFSRQSAKETNCGQHCVSMICHIPVSVVSAQLGTNKGTSSQQVSGVLRWFGQDAERYKPCKSWEQVTDLAIVHVVNHWAVFFKGWIYDSCKGIIHVDHYKHRVKGYIEVKIPV